MMKHEQQLADLAYEFSVAVSKIRQGRRSSADVETLLRGLRSFNKRNTGRPISGVSLIDTGFVRRAVEEAFETAKLKIMAAATTDCVESPTSSGKPTAGAALVLSSDKLGLSIRALNCLREKQIGTVKELVTQSKDDLLGIKNFGRVCLREIESKMDDLGLRLGMTEEEIKAIEASAQK